MLRKILAVDDSALIHQMYKLFLSRYKNCKLVSAMNGLEALDKLGQEEGIDLILLDINMPVMNGLEFLQRVQKENAYKDIPVIIISTEGKEEDTIRGLKMGARGYVKKPFQASELHSLIEKITVREARKSARLPLMEFEVSDELVSIYLEDAREQLAILDDVLLRLERDGAKPEVVNSVLGPLHTLKGNSGMIGLVAIKDYVHRLEEVFGRARDGALALDGGVLDRLFEGATALRGAVEAACGPARETPDLAPAQAALAALLEQQAPAARPAAGKAEAAAAAADGAAAGQTCARRIVRVDFAKLDHLLNLVGELIVNRTKLDELARRLAVEAPAAGAALVEAVHQVGVVSSQLQETIMDVRMLPIRHVFERFPRLVRDLARQQGKQIELVLQGEETRVDKADDRRARRAARAHDPQRGRSRHRAAGRRGARAASRRPARSCSRRRRSRTRSSSP